MDNRPRRSAGRLRAIRALLTLMLVGDVLFLISAALTRVSGQTVTDLDVPVGVVYGPQPYLLRQANLQLLPLTVHAYVHEPSLVQTLLGLFAHGLATGLAALPMIVLARRLVDRARATHPFTLDMVRGLRRLGLVVLIGGLLAELTRIAAAVAFYRSAVPGGDPYLGPDSLIGFWWLLLGLVILAFAQVVEHGCALRAELDDVI